MCDLSHRHNIYTALSIMYQVYSNGRRALVHYTRIYDKIDDGDDDGDGYDDDDDDGR